MRVGNRGADLQEQLEALANAEASFVAPRRDRRAFDEFHHEKWASVRRHAAVEQRRDVRVREVREDLSLATEARQRDVGSKSLPHDLDRDTLVILVVGANGLVHVPHATDADGTKHVICAEPLAFDRDSLAMGVDQRRRSRLEARFSGFGNRDE